MPLFLSALLGALPAVVSGVSSLFGGGGGGGGFLGGLFGGGGGPSAGPRITTVSGTSRTGLTRAQLGGSFPVQPIFGGFDPFGGARPSFPVSRSSFGIRGRAGRAPQAPQFRPTQQPPTIPLGHHDFAADTARAEVGAHAQISQGRLRFTGGPTVAACPRGSPHPLPTIPLSMTPDNLARIHLGASCV